MEPVECRWCKLEGEPRPAGSARGDLPPPPRRSSKGPSSALYKTSLEQPSLRHSVLRLIVIGVRAGGSRDGAADRDRTGGRERGRRGRRGRKRQKNKRRTARARTAGPRLPTWRAGFSLFRAWPNPRLASERSAGRPGSHHSSRASCRRRPAWMCICAIRETRRPDWRLVSGKAAGVARQLRQRDEARVMRGLHTPGLRGKSLTAPSCRPPPTDTNLAVVRSGDAESR
jgi:hypothetical protein